MRNWMVGYTAPWMGNLDRLTHVRTRSNDPSVAVRLALEQELGNDNTAAEVLDKDQADQIEILEVRDDRNRDVTNEVNLEVALGYA